MIKNLEKVIKFGRVWWKWDETCDRCGREIFTKSITQSKEPDVGRVSLCNKCMRKDLDNKEEKGLVSSFEVYVGRNFEEKTLIGKGDSETEAFKIGTQYLKDLKIKAPYLREIKHDGYVEIDFGSHFKFLFIVQRESE